MIEVGKTLEKTFQVTEPYTAKSMGSGELEVLATPMMVCFMENTAAELLGSFLEDDQTSVGSLITTSHLAPTPKGSEVKVSAKIIGVEAERMVTFEVWAEDPDGLIGKGEHRRAIVNKERFMQKASAKKINFS